MYGARRFILLRVGWVAMRFSADISGFYTLAILVCAPVAAAQTPASSAQAKNPAPSAPAPAEQGDAGTAKAKPEAAPRNYSQFRQNSLLGSTGLVHLVAADSGAPGTFRLSFVQSTYAGSGFLCPTAAACGNRPPGVTDSQDSVRRTGQDVALSATPWSFLEASVGLHAYAVSDNFASPNLLQTIGDTSFAVKVFTPRRPDRNLFCWRPGSIAAARWLGQRWRGRH